MTDRLYYTDCYLREFDAVVVDRAESGRRVYLDRTAFYPTSGGQPFDTGRLGGIGVIDVVDEGDRIAHILAEPMQNDRVTGQLDWGRRFDHMQQHTGQHLLSAVIEDLLGYRTVGVHFGRDAATLDLDTATLSPEQLTGVEDRANEIVVQNRPVKVAFEQAQAATGLRKQSDRAGSIRVITIEGLDRSACGGTHVRATGEIGAILIRKVERARKGVRVEFLCGGRALRRARADQDLLAQLAAGFTASPDELPGLVEAQRQELKDAVAVRRELQSTLDLYRAQELYRAAKPDATGIRRVVLREANQPLEDMRRVAQAFASMPMAIFVGAVANPPAMVLAASSDAGVDAAGVLKGLLASVGGRGGGSPTLAQGILPGRSQLDAVLASLGGVVAVESQESKV